MRAFIGTSYGLIQSSAMFGSSGSLFLRRRPLQPALQIPRPRRIDRGHVNVVLPAPVAQKLVIGDRIQSVDGGERLLANDTILRQSCRSRGRLHPDTRNPGAVRGPRKLRTTRLDEPVRG